MEGWEWEELGHTESGLARLTATPVDQQRSWRTWALRGSAGAVQLLERPAYYGLAIDLGWDYGSHRPAEPLRDEEARDGVLIEDCPLIEGGRCEFRPNGMLGQQFGELVEGIERGGVEHDAAIWQVLEAAYAFEFTGREDNQ